MTETAQTETKDPKLQVRFVGPRKKYTFKNAIKQRAQRQKRIHIEKRPNNYELIQYKHHDKYVNIATIALQSKGLKEAHKVELHSSDIETAFKALLQRTRIERRGKRANQEGYPGRSDAAQYRTCKQPDRFHNSWSQSSD